MITSLLIMAIIVVSVYNIIMATILYKLLNKFEVSIYK
jgi:hypothetical protein